jgi:hypothetical protein
MLLEVSIEKMCLRIDMHHEEIFNLESSTGVRWDRSQMAVSDDIDLTKLIRDINSVTTNLVHMSWFCSTYLSMLSFLDDIANQYREKVILNEESVDDATSTESLLFDKHKYLRCWLVGMEGRVKYLSQRARAQFQTVCSLI